MANVIGYTEYYIDTTAGRFVFYVIDIDAPVEVGTAVRILGAEQPIYENVMVSVISGNSGSGEVTPPFSYDNGKFRFYRSTSTSDVYIEYLTDSGSWTGYHTQGRATSTDSAVIGSYRGVVRGTNGVTFIVNGTGLVSYAPTMSSPNLYYPEATSSSFGVFTIASVQPSVSTTPNEAHIALGNALMSGATPLVPPVPDDDPYSDVDGEGEISGGGSGSVGIPGFPGLTATDTGIIGLFAPSSSQMRALADFMWTDFGGEGTTVESILSEIVQALKRTISNPLDYVFGLNIIPSQGLSIGGSQTIRFGFISSGVSMPRLSNQYFEVDCGELSFSALCGNTFLDYAPYSKFSIYLPYIGVKDVDANDFVGHTIGVKYHGDVVTGGITAYITKDGTVMYQYSGSCALSIPLSSDGWGSTISGAVHVATSFAAAFTGGPAGMAAAAASGAAAVASNPSMLSPQVARSGAVSGSAGCMGVQRPFVIREAVRFHSTAYFNTIAGYPSYYYRTLGDVSGFTTVLECRLENIPATRAEIEEIERLLKEGAIF